MERILITGDTHGNIDNVVRLLDNVDFTGIMHLGDYSRDALALKKLYPDMDFYTVSGNNDFGGVTEKTVTVAGRKIYICHGHNLGVGEGLLRLKLAAQEKEADVAIYAHTHIAANLMIDGVRIFSPGSPSRPRDGKSAVGILEAEEDYFELAHYYFE